MFENWSEDNVVTALTRHIVKSQVGGGPVTGQHARVRQVRVSAEVDARIEVLAADRHVKASDIIREALAAYLASAVSSGGRAPHELSVPGPRFLPKLPVSERRRGFPAVAATRASASAKTARTRSGVAAK